MVEAAEHLPSGACQRIQFPCISPDSFSSCFHLPTLVSACLISASRLLQFTARIIREHIHFVAYGVIGIRSAALTAYVAEPILDPWMTLAEISFSGEACPAVLRAMKRAIKEVNHPVVYVIWHVKLGQLCQEC